MSSLRIRPTHIVKILDGCGLNGKYWFFAAATTTVGYTLRVEDALRGTFHNYANPDLAVAATVTDTAALPCGP